jgi:hypothetical protein
MGNILKGTADFFSKYIFQIILFAFIFLLIRGYMIINDVKIIKKNPTLEKVVVIEDFGRRRPYFKDTSSNFCHDAWEDPNGAHRTCGELETFESCIVTDCCGWATYKDKKKNKCVGGSALGPTHYPKYGKKDFKYSFGN